MHSEDGETASESGRQLMSNLMAMAGEASQACTCDALNLSVSHLLGCGMGGLSMSQLDALEEVHNKALERLRGVRWDLIRRQERERAEEEACREKEAMEPIDVIHLLGRLLKEAG